MKKIYVTKIRKEGEKIVGVKIRRTLLASEEEIDVTMNWLMQKLTDPNIEAKTAIKKPQGFAEGAELILIENSAGVVSVRTKANQAVNDNLDRLPCF